MRWKNRAQVLNGDTIKWFTDVAHFGHHWLFKSGGTSHLLVSHHLLTCLPWLCNRFKILTFSHCQTLRLTSVGNDMHGQDGKALGQNVWLLLYKVLLLRTVKNKDIYVQTTYFWMIWIINDCQITFLY